MSAALDDKAIVRITPLGTRYVSGGEKLAVQYVSAQPRPQLYSVEHIARSYVGRWYERLDIHEPMHAHVAVEVGGTAYRWVVRCERYCSDRKLVVVRMGLCLMGPVLEPTR